MSAGEDDRLGGRSDALESGRKDSGPIRRFGDDDRGEDPAAHFPHGDAEVARRLAGADTGSLRSQERDEPASQTGDRAGQHPPAPGTRDGDRPPIYEGATSTSAIGGLDAGMGSGGVSAGSGAPAGSPAMGGTGGRSGTAPGVGSTTRAGYSTMTGTGGPAPGRDDADQDTTQPPRDPGS